MKNTQLSISFFLLALIYLSNGACTRIDYTKELAQVDSLSVKVDSILSNLNAIDTSEVMGYIPLMKEDLQWIQENISEENVNAAKIFIYKVKTVNKLSLTFTYDYVKAKKESELSKTQLFDLRKDLVNSSIEKNDALKYIEDERKAVEAINNHTIKMIERINILEDYPEVRKEFYLNMRNK